MATSQVEYEWAVRELVALNLIERGNNGVEATMSLTPTGRARGEQLFASHPLGDRLLLLMACGEIGTRLIAQEPGD